MEVKAVPTLGWTRGSVAATILLVTQEQRDQIAKRVRTLMQEQGFTNAALAYEAGVAEKTISRLINAKKESRYDTLDKVARALGITEQELRGPPPAPLGLDAAAPANGAEVPASVLERLDAIDEKLADLLAYREQVEEEMGHFDAEAARDFFRLIQELRSRQGRDQGKRELQSRRAAGRPPSTG